MEKRLLVAFILMGLVLFLTPYFYKPAPAPKVAEQKQPAKTSEQTPAPPPVPPAEEPAPPAASPAAPAAATSAQKRETFVVDTNLYRIELTNQGAAVRSWILKKYLDSAGKPVELVNTAALAKTGPSFQIVFVDQKPPVDLNQVLYVARPAQDGLGFEFEYSDGKVTSKKSFHFEKNSYLSQVSSEVRQNGTPVPHLLAWRGGFGDHTVYSSATVQHSVYYDLSANKLVVHEAKAASSQPLTEGGNYSFAGLEDVYFAAVFVAPGGVPVQIRTVADSLAPAPNEKEVPHVGAAVGGSGINNLALFVGPKDVDILKRVDPKLQQLVDFGWFALLAKPLFIALHWLNDRFVHNYGWSIILVTIAINFLLLPLKLSSMRSMKRMQALAPQIAAINEKYKNVGLRDPRKAEQNQEVMELYKKHGANPMGGCVPMLLQIPFFFAFYKVLSVSIELRHAHWLWVTDLSQPETIPIRILPLTMLATQFVLQKMTPSTSADPTQQRMMLIMPLVLGFMFYNVQSGLVLYWLTGNIVGIGQQWFFNKLTPAPAPIPAPSKVTAKKKTRT